MLDAEDVWRRLGGSGITPIPFASAWKELPALARDQDRLLPVLIRRFGTDLNCAQLPPLLSAESLLVGAETIYRVVVLRDAESLREDLGDQARIGNAYRRRLIWELIQNLHDALAQCAVTERRVIGAFGIGIKAMTAVTDAILLHSGPFRLRFDGAEIERISGISRDWPLFAFPLPDLGTLDSQSLPDEEDADGQLTLATDEAKRHWIHIVHKGAPFDAEDVVSFRRRNMGQKAENRLRSNPSRLPTRISFRLKHGTEEELASALQRIDASTLLFLPHLRKLAVVIDKERRVLEIEPVANRKDGTVLATLCHCRNGAAVAPEPWLLLEGKDGIRTAAMPVDAHEGGEEQPLQLFFPITEANSGTRIRLHSRHLKVDDTRERLDDRDEARQVNAREVEALADLICSGLGVLAGWINGECDQATAETLRRAICSAPAGILPSGQTDLTSPLERLGATHVAAGLRAALLRRMTGTDVPCVAATANNLITLLPASRVLSLEPKLSQDGARLLGSPLPDTRCFAWSDQADRILGTASCLGITPPEAGPIGQVILERLRQLCVTTANGEAEDALYPVAQTNSAADWAASMGAWLQRSGLHDVRPAPLVVGHIPAGKPRFRRGAPQEPQSVIELFGRLDWATVDVARYGQLAGGIEWIERLCAKGWISTTDDSGAIFEALYDANVPDVSDAVVRVVSDALEREVFTDSTLTPPILHAAEAIAAARIDNMQSTSANDRTKRWLRVHLAGIHLPAVDGTLRRACELTRNPNAPPALVVDYASIRRWLADDKAVERLLDACSVWPEDSFPLHILVRRLPADDPAFGKEVRRWQNDWPGVAAWYRTLPVPWVLSTLGILQGHEERRSHIPAQERLPFSGRRQLVNNGGRPWCECVGQDRYYDGDRIAFLCDIPREFLDEDGLVRADAAESLARSLTRSAILSSAIVVNAKPWRNSQKRWAERVSAAGDLPSPAWFRLRATPFLKADPNCASPETPLRPGEAMRWHGSRLNTSPLRVLPVVSTTPSIEPVLNTLSVADELDPERPEETPDPRWLLATLVRLGRTASSQVTDEIAQTWQRVAEFLGRAIGFTAAGRRTSPFIGTWPQYFEMIKDLTECRRAAGSFLLDAVEMGFLDEQTIEPLRFDQPAEMLEQLPILLHTPDGYSFTPLRDLRDEGHARVIYPSTAERGEIAALQERFALAQFGEDNLALSHLLRIPHYLPPQHRLKGDRSTGKTVEHLRQCLETLREPILELIASTQVAGTKITADRLGTRWVEGQLEVLHYDPREAVVRVAGFEDIELRLDRGIEICVALDRWDSRREKYRPQLGLRADLDEDTLQQRLYEIAAPLTATLGLTGAGYRYNLECLLLRVSSTKSLAEIAGQKKIPHDIAVFLDGRGIANRPDAMEALARNLIHRFAPVFAVLRFSPRVPPFQREQCFRARVPMMAWNCIVEAARAAFDVFPRKSVRELLAPEREPCPISEHALSLQGWEGLAPALYRLRQLNASAVDSALLETGALVPELCDGSSKDDLSSANRGRLLPWWRSRTPDAEWPVWSAHPQLASLLGDRTDFLNALAIEVEGLVYSAPDLAGALAASVRCCDEAPLIKLFARQSWPRPTDESRRRQEWGYWIDEFAGPLEGLAALTVLLELSDDPDDFDRKIVNHAAVARDRLKEAVDKLQCPDPVAPRIAELFTQVSRKEVAFDHRHPENTSAAEWRLWIVEALRIAGLESLYIGLRDAARRSLRIAGERFATPADAKSFFSRHQHELPPPLLQTIEGGMVTPEQDFVAPPGGGSARSGRRNFTARAGVIGKEGERYVHEELKKQYVRIWDVANRDTARKTLTELEDLANADDSLGNWVKNFLSLQAAARDGGIDTPGFDLLALQKHNGEGEQFEAHGIEVKTTSEDVDELDFEWTENEYNAATAVESRTWRWPVAAYIIVALTRLWARGKDNALLEPRMIVLHNPLRCGERVSIQRGVSHSYRVSVGLQSGS